VRGRSVNHNPFAAGTARYSGRALRRGRGRLRRALLWLKLATLGACAGASIYGFALLWNWISTSDNFEVRGIELVGVEGEWAREVRNAAASAIGVNLFRVDVPELENAVRSLPFVKTCAVGRRLPHTLVIRVTPRRPLFVLNCGGLWRVDREGVIVGPVEDGDVERHLVASCASEPDSIEPGGKLDPADVAAIRRAIVAIERTSPELMRELSEVCVAADGSVTLFTKDPPHRVLLGQGEPKRENLAALRAVLGDVRRRGIKGAHIDLRFSRQIVVRPGGRGMEAGSKS